MNQSTQLYQRLLKISKHTLEIPAKTFEQQNNFK